MAFIFATLTVVAAWTSTKKARAPVLLNRQQTEEWKGWMQARPCHIPSAQGVRALNRHQEGPRARAGRAAADQGVEGLDGGAPQPYSCPQGSAWQAGVKTTLLRRQRPTQSDCSLIAADPLRKAPR